MNFDDNSAESKLDDKVREIEKETQFDKIDKIRRDICARSVLRNLTRDRHFHRLEEELYEDEVNRQANRNVVQMRVEQEEKLAKELNRLRQEDIREIKMRQHLRETDMELRELQSKLRTAYVTKELSAQLAEKEYLKMKEKIDEKRNCEIMKTALLTEMKAEQAEAEEEYKRKAEYRKELQDQIILQHQQKQYMYEEFLREKKLLDEIVQRIHDEDEQEQELKMYKMKKTKEEIDAFKKARDIWRQRERQALEEENTRIEEYLKQKEIEDRERDMRKIEEDSAKAKIIEELSKKMYTAQLKKKERDEVIQELLEEEMKEKEEQKIKMELKRQIEKRIEMQNTLVRQLEEQKERLRQEELEDARYKEQMLAKALEDEKLEQMSVEKRRRKMLDLRREIEEHMKERRAKRAEELRTIMYLQEQDKIREANRRKIIEEERLAILKEHAKNLIGYIPPGVLRLDDLPHLGLPSVNQSTSKCTH